MNVIKRLLHSAAEYWNGKPEPAPVPPVVVVPPPAPIPWERILQTLVPADVRRDYVMPETLPGVRPSVLPTESTGLKLAMDQGTVEPMALDDGTPLAWGNAPTIGGQGPGLYFLGFPYLAELLQITEYRTPCESLANEMTRRWVKLKSKSKAKIDEKIKDIEDCMEAFKVREHFRKCATGTEGFGRMHLGINIKGQDDDATRQTPLLKIEKGSLLGFNPIEPYWMTPYSWNSTRPREPDFYKPQSWFELGKKTHATRYCTFIFREVPDLLKPAYDFAGISMTQLMLPYVTRWLRTAKNVNDMINIFSVVSLATDLQSLLQDPVEFMKRIQTFTQGRDNRGMMLTNKDTEELTINDASLASLDKLQAQAQEHMSTPSHTPLVEFFGITPSGLNASSEGEMQVRNKYVHGMQMLGFELHLIRVLELIQMHLYGEVDEDITHEWLPLYEPTGKEIAEERKSDADRDAVYLDKNVVSADEVRDKLRNNPESGYDGLVGDAPEPIEWDDQEGGDPNAPPGAPPAGKPPAKKE